MPGILDRMACGVALALAIGRPAGGADPPPPPRGKKPALFWGVLDVHKTSQIPSKMALGRGRFGARGGSPKTANHQQEIVFFIVIFWYFLMLLFFGKNLGTCKKHRKYSSKNCNVFDLVKISKFKMWKGGGGVSPPLCLGRFQTPKKVQKARFLGKIRNAVNSSVFAVCGLLPWKM